MQNLASQYGQKKFSTATLTKISVISVIAYILTWFEVGIPIFPSFLKFDLSDIPVIISALSMGSGAGVFVALIKNVLRGLLQTTSGGIGEAANFIIGCAFVLPLSFVYKKKKSYVLGAILGVVCMSLVGCVLNYTVLIPLYATVFGAPISVFVDIANALNKYVTDLFTLVAFAILPFNLIKGTLISFVGYILFKSINPVLKRLG